MSRRRLLLIRAALRQHRARQRSVCLPRVAVYAHPLTGFAAPSVRVGAEEFSIEFYGTTTGSSDANYPTVYNAAAEGPHAPGALGFYAGMYGQNGIREVVFGGLENIVPVGRAQSDPARRMHVVLTRAGTALRVYIDGALATARECAEPVDFGALRLGLANSSEAGFARLYDRALAAAEVTTLYNGGDPAGHVLPAAAKTGGARGERVALTGRTSYAWQADDPNYSASIPLDRELTDGCFYRLRITVSDYRAGAPFVHISGTARADIPARNGTHTILLRMVRTGNSRNIYLYGGPVNSDRRLTLTVESITPAGCVAEYLPQNIVPAWEVPMPPARIVGDDSYTWTGADDPVYAKAIHLTEPLAEGKPWRLTVRVSGYEAGAPFILVNTKASIDIPPADGTYTFTIMQSNGYGTEFYIYGGLNRTDRRLTLKVERLEPARDVAGAWLDSACAAPPDEAVLPPLLETAGGCDMVCGGMNLILSKPFGEALHD